MDLWIALIGLAGAGAAALLGGWVWTLPCLVVWLAIYRARTGAKQVAAAIVPPMAWLVLFAATGDRRLYFCYSLQYAVYLACQRRDRGSRAAAAAGSLLIAIFVAVRIAQGATAAVLAVEIAVAFALLAVSLVMCGSRADTPARWMAVSAAASLLAFAGLAL